MNHPEASKKLITIVFEWIGAKDWTRTTTRVHQPTSHRATVSPTVSLQPAQWSDFIAATLWHLSERVSTCGPRPITHCAFIFTTSFIYRIVAQMLTLSFRKFLHTGKFRIASVPKSIWMLLLLITSSLCILLTAYLFREQVLDSVSRFASFVRRSGFPGALLLSVSN